MFEGPATSLLTLGTARTRPLEGARFRWREAIRNVQQQLDGIESEYRLDLRVMGVRLEGPVTRRTSLGPRANTAVTLWA